MRGPSKMSVLGSCPPEINLRDREKRGLWEIKGLEMEVGPINGAKGNMGGKRGLWPPRKGKANPKGPEGKIWAGAQLRPYTKRGWGGAQMWSPTKVQGGGGTPPQRKWGK